MIYNKIQGVNTYKAHDYSNFSTSIYREQLTTFLSPLQKSSVTTFFMTLSITIQHNNATFQFI